MKLRLFTFTDVFAWELPPFIKLTERMNASGIEVSRVHVTEYDKDSLAGRHAGKGPVWIVSRNWGDAIEYLGATKYTGGPVWVSILQNTLGRSAVMGLLLQTLTRRNRKNIHLMVNSPLTHRFFKEILELKDDRLVYLPLPMEMDLLPKKEEGPFTVGALSAFTAESGLPYLMAVAHYVKTKNSDVRFLIQGMGPLYAHLRNLAGDLGISSSLDVLETVNPHTVSKLDALIFSPNQNENFLPLLCAAEAGIPVLTTDVFGIGEYVRDSHTGFIVPANEVKPMGELVIRLSKNPVLCKQLATHFRIHSLEKFSFAKLLPEYLKTFGFPVPVVEATVAA